MKMAKDDDAKKFAQIFQLISINFNNIFTCLHQKARDQKSLILSGVLF